MILSSHGLIASQIASFDADAVAFFGRVTTAGGSLSATEKAAVNQLVLDLKANSLWTPMKAIYPMVGASAAACAQNLKSSSFTGTFSSGWTFASTGVTPNGTSAYMDTSLTPSTALSSINDVHLSFYSRTQNTTTGGWNIGVDTSAPNPGSINLGQYFAAVSQKLFNNGSYPTYAVTSTETNTRGLAIGVAESSVLRKLHFNGSLLATTTNTTNIGLPNRSLYVGSGRNSVTGNAADFSPHECSLASIGDGLTTTQASNFYTAVQAFQTTLSRNV
jgi:hypothetical protein